MSIALNTCCSQPCNDSRFIQIVEMLGPVLFRAKPAEIVNFPKGSKMAVARKEQIKKMVDKGGKIQYREFTTCHGCTKLLFFDINMLETTLMDEEIYLFLQFLDYPLEFNIETYLDILITKMKKGEMPHEIGVFLGYPLKDVMGFMGYSTLKLTKINGWKVYGDPQQSDELYNRISTARSRFKELLKIHQPENILSVI